VLFNGDGTDYTARITDIQGKSATVSIESAIKRDNESSVKIHLYQSLAKGDKMELIIQKCIELGVSEITPMMSQRSNVKLDKKRINKKLEHWRNIAISACEQSGRASIPTINEPQPLKSIRDLNVDVALYLEPRATMNIKSLEPFKQCAIFIGPEGGLSESDLEHLVNIGATGIQLGPRILRTETAGLACISIIQSHFGDL